MYVEHFFHLNRDICTSLRMRQPVFGYGNFGEFMYYSHYSRLLPCGRQEQWADTVVRVIEGVLSIRKDWYIKHKIPWHDEGWQNYASSMAHSMFSMEWLPPGRGLWAMGTSLVYERGCMPLINCAFTEIGVGWIDDLAWLMDSLMNGAGVSFEPIKSDLRLIEPTEEYPYVVGDSREGWVLSVVLLLTGYLSGRVPVFDYSLIRKKGMPLKTFGGYASGSAPLEKLHEQIQHCCRGYLKHASGDEIRFKTDIANLIGVCVVAGNLRRSAEMALGSVHDETFMNLKDYSIYPERKAWGWMSNNATKMKESEDFNKMDSVAWKMIENGEPSIVNMINLQRGRLGHDDHVRIDNATGLNPCGEIPLESREVCNVAETLPTRCNDHNTWLVACEYATFYTSTVTLLPTHQESTNAVVMRNRRIGVSTIDVTGWIHENSMSKVIRWMREGYLCVRKVNSRLAAAAGIPESIRVTTVKPGGTVPKIAGRNSGMSYPNFRHMLRRVRIQMSSPMYDIMSRAGVPGERDVVSDDTWVFEFPVYTGETPTIDEVSLWQQAMLLVLVQREWSDNAVSSTLMFKRSEEKDVMNVLAAIMPSVKGVCMLPYETGMYAQMPEERITTVQYQMRCLELRDVDWTSLKDDPESEKYCEGETCENNK